MLTMGSFTGVRPAGPTYGSKSVMADSTLAGEIFGVMALHSIKTGSAPPRRKPTLCIGRREFITLLGGAAAALPLPARAQGPLVRMPRIGLMDDEPLWDNFRQGLRDLGHVENRDIAIEYRPAEGKVDRLAQAARELVSLPVDVIVAGGSPAARAARQATSTIPIVFIGVGDPVKAGFVVCLARPGGNMTGYSEFAPDLLGKRLEILKECVPTMARVAFIWNPDNDSNVAFLEELERIPITFEHSPRGGRSSCILEG